MNQLQTFEVDMRVSCHEGRSDNNISEEAVSTCASSFHGKFLVQTGYVENSGVRVYYEAIGHKSLPPLLLVHGNGNCIQDWHALGYTDTLTKDFQLIMVDGRGFGKSGKPIDAAAYAPEIVASDFIAVLDALGIKKCHYFGNSRGGNMAFILGQLYPQRFLSFSIVSAEPFGSVGQMMSEQFVGWLNNGTEYFVVELEKVLGRKFPSKVRHNFLMNNPEAMIAANTPSWPDFSRCFSESLTPILLLVGGLSTEVEANKRCLPLVKAGEMKILLNMTHADVYWDGPRISEVITEFVQRHFPKVD